MDVKMVNIGFGNLVMSSRIVAILSPDSAPLKRIVNEARSQGVLLDASFGRKTRAVLVLDDRHVLLSALNPETIAQRLTTKVANS